MMFEKTKWVWQNGKIVPWDEATVHVSAHALHYGTAFFEGIRCYETESGPAIFRLKEHVERLCSSTEAYGFKIPYPTFDIEAAAAEVVRCNQFASCYIRPLCYFGSATLFVNPRVPKIELAIMAWPWDHYLKKEAEEKGVRVTISPWRRFHPSMMPTTSKASGGYLNGVLAVTDAVKRGYHEAILLNQEGNVAEGSGENVFMVKGNAVITNDERSSTLLGITRDSILHIARDLGYPVKIEAFSPGDLFAADEAFFTGTAAQVAPICEVDGKPIGSGKPGPITQKLQQTFSQVVQGRLPQYSHWLYLVNAPAKQASFKGDGPH